MELSNRFQRMSLDHRCEPYGSHCEKHRSVNMNWRVARGGGFNSADDLFAVRGCHHGLQVVRHGDDGQQHRNQNQVGDPRGRMGVNMVF